MHDLKDELFDINHELCFECMHGMQLALTGNRFDLTGHYYNAKFMCVVSNKLAYMHLHVTVNKNGCIAMYNSVKKELLANGVMHFSTKYTDSCIATGKRQTIKIIIAVLANSDA